MDETKESATSRVFGIFDLIEQILLLLGGPRPYQHQAILAHKLDTLVALRHVNRNFREAIDNSYRLQRRIVVLTVYSRLPGRSYGRETAFFSLLYVLQKHFVPFRSFDRVDRSSATYKPGGIVVLQATAPPDMIDVATTFAPSHNALWRSVRLRCFGYCSHTRVALTVHGAAQTNNGLVRRGKQSLHVTGNTTLGELQDLYRRSAEKILVKQSKWITFEDSQGFAEDEEV